MKNNLKKSYMISRLIIAIITFIVFCILFINEDSSWNIIIFIFTIIAFVLSFPSSIISKKLLTIGDNIQKRVLKVLYYSILLPFASILITVIMYIITYFVYSAKPIPEGLAPALGYALGFLFIITVEVICIILPVIQTILVLIIRRFIKD